MLHWLSRCLPGISNLLLVLLLVCAFGNIEWYQPLPLHRCPQNCPDKRSDLRNPLGLDSGSRTLKLRPSQAIFIFYTLLVHFDTLLFASRLCLAILLVKSRSNRALQRRHHELPSPSLPEPDSFLLQPGLEAVAFKADDALQADEVTHAIILPNYGEDIDTLRTTLAVLASHPRAMTRYKVYLAMEQKEAGSASKAASLISSFHTDFLGIHATFHPSNLPGEIAGKSSNVAFAACEIFRQHRLDEDKGEVIITVIDCNASTSLYPLVTLEDKGLILGVADTHLLQDYFTEIRRLHLTSSDSSHALYVCPIIFDRNAHETPTLVRIADVLWGAAGLAAYLPLAPVHIPTSVYSLPLSLAEEVGGWDGDPTAIGEDMHMLLKTYFSSHRRLVTKPIYSAASQCNISSSQPRGWRRTLDTLRARYRQALRHMWGSLDTGYAVRRAMMTRRPRLSHLSVFHLLWEAHMLPTHFIIILVASALYTVFVPHRHIHPLLLWTFGFTTILRNGGFVVMQIAFTLYDSYHALCVNTRARDMEAARISDMFAYRKPLHLKYLAERILFPVVGVVYSAIPAVHAQFSHFWTDKLVYTVSSKPVVEHPV